MTAPLALIFDVDGTLADTEAAHREAFNEAFVEEQLGWHWDDRLYLRLLGVAGGKERLDAYWQEMNGGEPMPTAVLERVHAAKTRRYTSKVDGHQLALRPGVLNLLGGARERGLPLAIATTTTPANVDALLRAPLGERWRESFAAVGDASTADRKKPDPQVYLGVLEVLGRRASACVAFEDSEIGLRAARAAGIPTVITPTRYTANDDFTGALAVRADLGALQLDELLAMTHLG